GRKRPEQLHARDHGSPSGGRRAAAGAAAQKRDDEHKGFGQRWKPVFTASRHAARLMARSRRANVLGSTAKRQERLPPLVRDAWIARSVVWCSGRRMLAGWRHVSSQLLVCRGMVERPR